ncbi:hypothetical protein FV233_00230 [Methylobacterium sp. WL7]|nr:hypothetical protein FV233_00230 [Methylobacterium sp. WL7]
MQAPAPSGPRCSHVSLYRPRPAPSPVRERAGVRDAPSPERPDPSPYPSPARERGPALHPAMCETAARTGAGASGVRSSTASRTSAQRRRSRIDT